MPIKNSFLIIFSLLLFGCNSDSNDPVAQFIKFEGRYEIIMTGRRLYISHDPWSAIFRESYATSTTLVVPRISGEVRGDELPKKDGFYHQQGSIKFTEDKMIVNLFFVNTDDGKLQSISWNGEYELKEIIENKKKFSE